MLSHTPAHPGDSAPTAAPAAPTVATTPTLLPELPMPTLAPTPAFSIGPPPGPPAIATSSNPTSTTPPLTGGLVGLDGVKSISFQVHPPGQTKKTLASIPVAFADKPFAGVADPAVAAATASSSIGVSEMLANLSTLTSLAESAPADVRSAPFAQQQGTQSTSSSSFCGGGGSSINSNNIISDAQSPVAISSGSSSPGIPSLLGSTTPPLAVPTEASSAYAALGAAGLCPT